MLIGLNILYNVIASLHACEAPVSVSWSALIWPPKLTAEHWVAAEGAGRVCSAQGRPRLRSLVTITKSDHSPGLRRLNIVCDCVLAWSGAWSQSPCLCERLGLTQCNRFPWWAMSDCWSLDTGPVHWPGETSAWSEATSDPACDQLPDTTNNQSWVSWRVPSPKPL